MGMSGCMASAAQSGAGRLRFRCRVVIHRLSVALVQAPRMGSSFEQCVDIGRTHDGPVAHEGLVVILDAVMVVEIVDHDAEGFLDAAWRVVAQPIDTFEPRAVAEVKTRYRVDAYRGLPRQIAGAKPQQGRAQLLALRRVIPPAATFELWQQRGIGIASIRKPLTEPAPKPRYRRKGGKALH